jgi:D-aminopeptidase
MVVLATDAPLTALELGRLARRAGHGLARTGSVMQHGSGEFVIAFSTQNQYAYSSLQPVDTVHRLNDTLLDGLFVAVVESVEEAVYNALIAATTLHGRGGHVLYALPHESLRG